MKHAPTAVQLDLFKQTDLFCCAVTCVSELIADNSMTWVCIV